MIYESIDGHKNLPRYFTQVFEAAKDMRNGILDFKMPDGRIFRAKAKGPGPVAQIDVHNPDVFARLIREGDLGFVTPILTSGGQRLT